MGALFELTTLEVNAYYTGSFSSTACANSMGVAAPAPYLMTGSNSTITGSWFGLGNSWGVASGSVALFSGSLDSELWWGIDTSWGAPQLIVTESRDRTDTVTNATPFIDQGIGPGDWDPFPIPPAVPGPVLPQRDTTRYRKSYSSQRLQPNRIRLVKS